jgi:DNA topoisomerase IB
VVDHVLLGVHHGREALNAESGRHRTAELTDPDALRVVRSLRRARGGERLLAYRRRHDWQELHGADVNAYRQDATGLDATAKDFRTWHATVLAAIGLAVSAERAGDGETARRRVRARVVREAADYLGNTPAFCRAASINPRLLELYDVGRTIRPALGDLAGTAACPAPEERWRTPPGGCSSTMREPGPTGARGGRRPCLPSGPG